MPVVVTCQCGRRFAASDQLLGQEVPCPACGNPLSVADAYSRSQDIYVSCECGRAFCAPSVLRGKNTQCPACGGNIKVPGVIDLAEDEIPVKELVKEHATTLLLPDPDDHIPWDRLKRMCAVGVLVFVSIAGAAWVYELAQREVKIDWKSSTPPVSAAPNVPFSLPTRPAAPSLAAKDVAEPKSEESVAPVEPADTAMPVARLSPGVQDWYGQSGAKHAGVRRANLTDPPLAQFSWLTGLLPFLGHQKLYEQFDFNKSIVDGKNSQLGGTIVPEFLNPADDNQRWKGYPFDGAALTHFVGISGVEDSRNVVAAKLPRSDPRAGIFGYDDVARPEDIKDGTSHTAMMAGAGALPNPWVLGGGATIRGAREPLFESTSGIGTNGIGGGTIVVMADGSVRQINSNINPKVFKAMSTAHGGETYDVERVARPFDMHSLKEPQK